MSKILGLKQENKLEFLRRLCISHADIQMSLSAITFLNDVEKDEQYNYVELRRFKCYETAFIIAYARAFSKNKGGQYPRLDLSKIDFSFSPDQKSLHDKIVKLRDTIFAHSDQDFVNVRLDLFKDNINGKELPLIHSQFDEGLHYIDFVEMNAIMTMMNSILQALYVKMLSLSVELEKHLPLIISPDSTS